MIRQLPLLIIDLALVALATVFALVLRENFELLEAKLADLTSYLVFTLAAAALVFPAFRTTPSVWRFTTIADYLQILAATVVTVVGAVTLGFHFNRMDGVARSLPVLQGLLILFLLVGARILARVWHGARERSTRLEAPQEFGHETVLVVGLGELAGLYLRCVARFAPDRVRIAGILAKDNRHVGRSVHRYEVLGTAEEIADTLRLLEVHGVFVDRILVATAFETLSREAQDALLNIEKATSVSLEFLIDQMGLAPRSGSGVGGECSIAGATNSLLPFSFGAEYLEVLARRPYWRVKRALDFCVALSLLIVLAPLMLLAAALVAIDVGLPVTFWQQRPGLEGRPFKLYKLRTMAAAHDAIGRRMRDEERSSSIGRFLRRTRLDELPQLLNILFGEMSFVGPRPLLPFDQPAEFAARLLVRPGLTGWAQVKGGREISAADKGALDVWYVCNTSLALDINILVGTVATVIFGEKIDAAAIQQAWRDLRRAETGALEKFSKTETCPVSPSSMAEAEQAG